MQESYISGFPQRFDSLGLPIPFNSAKVEPPKPTYKVRYCVPSIILKHTQCQVPKVIQVTDAPYVTLNDLWNFIILTQGIILNAKDSYQEILKIMFKNPDFGKNKIVAWDTPSFKSDIRFYTHINNIAYFGERLQYLGDVREEKLAFEDLTKAGYRLSFVYQEAIAIFNESKHSINPTNIVNFIKHRIPVSWNTGRLMYKANISEKVIRVTELNTKYLRCTGEPGYKDDWLALFFGVWLSDYTQWIDESTYIQVGDQRVYVDHHNLFEGVTLSSYYHNSSEDYLKVLPFGIHPSEYFAKYLVTIAKTIISRVGEIQPPDNYPILDLSDSPHRQLLSGIDLMNEGEMMEHCIGGENYMEYLESGEELYFHLDIPGIPLGGTLSLVKTTGYNFTSWKHGVNYWKVDQFYGYDDESLRYHEEAQAVLDEFLNRYFVRNVVTNKSKESASAGFKVHDLYQNVPGGSPINVGKIHFMDLIGDPGITIGGGIPSHILSGHNLSISKSTSTGHFIERMFNRKQREQSESPSTRILIERIPCETGDRIIIREDNRGKPYLLDTIPNLETGLEFGFQATNVNNAMIKAFMGANYREPKMIDFMTGLSKWDRRLEVSRSDGDNEAVRLAEWTRPLKSQDADQLWVLNPHDGQSDLRHLTFKVGLRIFDKRLEIPNLFEYRIGDIIDIQLGTTYIGFRFSPIMETRETMLSNNLRLFDKELPYLLKQSRTLRGIGGDYDGWCEYR